MGIESCKGKVIGLYFAAHWSPPCRAFTSELARTYAKLKEQGKAFEVLFVSADKDQDGFNDFFESMPWLAVPFADEDRKERLAKAFGVTRLPTLVIVDEGGNLLNSSAQECIATDQDGRHFPWTEAQGFLKLVFSKKFEKRIEVIDVSMELDLKGLTAKEQGWGKDVVKFHLANLMKSLQLNQPEDMIAFAADHFRTFPLEQMHQLARYTGSDSISVIQNVSKKQMRETDRKKTWSLLKHEILHCANDSAQKAIEAITYQIKQGFPINARPFGDSMLHLVSAMGSCSLGAFLLTNGADLQLAREQDAAIPCEVAAAMGHLDLLKLFVRNGACIGRSMHIAAATGYAKLLHYLLEEGGTNVNCRSYGYSAFETAMLHEHQPVLAMLLDRPGLDLYRECSKMLCEHQKLSAGSNVVHMAAKLGRLKGIKAMKKSLKDRDWRALVKKRNIKGETPLEVADYIARAQLQEDYLMVWDGVQAAFRTGDWSGLIQLLGERGDKGGVVADPNSQDAAGWTVLMLAAIQDRVELATSLLDNGADVYTQSKNGFSALFWAEWMGSKRVAELLKAKGAVLSNHDSAGLRNLEKAATEARAEGDGATMAILRCQNSDAAALEGVGSKITFLTTQVTVIGGEHCLVDSKNKAMLRQGALDELDAEQMYQVELCNSKNIVSIPGKHLRLRDANNPVQLIEQRMLQQQGQTQMVRTHVVLSLLLASVFLYAFLCSSAVLVSRCADRNVPSVLTCTLVRILEPFLSSTHIGSIGLSYE